MIKMNLCGNYNKDKFSFHYERVDLDERMRDLRNFAKLFPPITSAPNIT